MPHPRIASIDQRHDAGPFDVIGDVHGCARELEDLLQILGYVNVRGQWHAPNGRTPVFIGDLADRGPRNVDAIRLAMALVEEGKAFCVPGNHDLVLTSYLSGRPTPIQYGLDATLAELDREPPRFGDEVLAFFDGLKSHYIFDSGRLVIAHTGLPEHLHGVDTAEVRQLAAYGVLDGEPDPSDPSKRHAWVETYRGHAAVVYGHTRTLEPVWRNNTIDIDTGCVYGWRLTALRWPERELVWVPARAEYFRATRPFLPLPAQRA